jgi:hypothetical protein
VPVEVGPAELCQRGGVERTPPVLPPVLFTSIRH